MRWFTERVTAFVKDFNLMPGFIVELGIDGKDRDMVLYKLGLIYQRIMEMQEERMSRNMETNRG